MENATAPLFGLIGHPLGHSLSPSLFDAAYGGKYRYDLIEGEYFDASYKKFLRSYKAVNVTAPFKEEAFERADVVTGPCALIGAANILAKGKDGVECHNSDFSGVILSVADALLPGAVAQCYSVFGADAHKKVHQLIRNELPDVFGRRPRALVVGCGGAGKAAAVAAAEMGFETWIANRSVARACAFVKGLPEYGFKLIPIEEMNEALKASDLVIYTLPVALDSLSDLSEGDYSSEVSKIVLEANYRTPSFSGAIREKLEKGGAQYIPGKRWLLFQAMSGYSIMTGEAPDPAALFRAGA